ncbi:ribosomal-protein-serine acetyltransferase [Salipaludibacillus neizhouensis]|uniref:Ribosomal-protein-serine acetyltransferase n=1 Tax=Salipaludibacillus neizhouensis TaxID=885475 RepID=A0A3A9KRD0_9BACI|nr:GNAT family protein [Salipaludibacillus neizhouensis]RKL67226.1 ribosomal-protein-serine acetyltransferase [Salipaludibacillus neizhouensis]
MFKATADRDTYISILEPRHADELFKVVDRSRESLGEWLSFPAFTKGVQDSKTFIEKSLNRFAANNGYWSGIWHKGELAGSIGYLYIDSQNSKTEIGYWLGKDFVGRGLVRKACKLMIEHAFTDLQLNKVEINIATKNIKSKAIPEYLGFTKEGVIRNYEFLNGQYLDRIVYGILKDDWITIHH